MAHPNARRAHEMMWASRTRNTEAESHAIRNGCTLAEARMDLLEARLFHSRESRDGNYHSSETDGGFFL